MRNRTGLSLGAALILVLTAGPVASSGADPILLHNRVPAPRPVQETSTSGQYTGMLAGDILLGTASFHLSPDVVIYELGTGFLPVGTVVANRYVYMSGTKSGDTDVIDMVILRPASDSYPDRGDESSHIRIMGNATPQ